MSKPLNPRLLNAIVERVSRPLEPPVVASLFEHPAPGGSLPTGAKVDVPSAAGTYGIVLARAGGDVRLLVEHSQLFIDEMPEYLSKIRSALDAHDGPALHGAAHRLHGAAANFEAAAVVGAARGLEDMGLSAEFADEAGAWIRLTGETTLLMTTLRTYTTAKSPATSPAFLGPVRK